jgi:signal transduction histidine kinase
MRKLKFKIKFEYRITIAYLCIGFLWILFSDKLLESFVTDYKLLTDIQTYKGSFYVTITALLLYFYVRRHLRRLKKINEEIIENKEKAEESDKLKSVFLENISHELRTPMNAIMGFSGLLTEKNLPEETRQEYTDILHKSTLQLLNIVENTITISHLETHQLRLNKINFSINALLLQLYEEFNLYKEQNNKSHIDLILYKPENENIILNSDYTRLHQIFSILIDNALKFTDNGKVEYGYSIEGNYLVFFVKDTGSGISDEDKALIFKSFSQGDAKFRKSVGGLGVGLTIAVSILKLFNSELIMNSKKNEGTEFKFKLPIIPKDLL